MNLPLDLSVESQLRLGEGWKIPSLGSPEMTLINCYSKSFNLFVP